ncbi:MAG: sulfatase-like hydrolase/transferase [Planctomycetia bacterium]|nr:sulfatase-like hydrolase/transferase [Planctomycetia bacterium]
MQKGKMDLDGVARFLELLKKSDVYDNSYIIVMGDHGGHLEPVLERKNPFFLVKRPGDTHEKMVTNDQPIFLRDIAPTILKDLGIVTEESYSFWNLSPEQKVERERCWERISHNAQ